jgi:hypothetical protein
MNYAEGAKNKKDYAEAALVAAVIFGKISEIDDLQKDAEKWMNET